MVIWFLIVTTGFIFYYCGMTCFYREVGKEKVKVAQSCLALWPHGLYSPWNSPGQNTGVGSPFLLQGIFPTQRSNPGLPHCRRILYQLSFQGSPTEPTGTCCAAHRTLFNVVWQPGWEEGLEENGCMYTDDGVSLLFTWNYHSIVYQLCPNKRQRAKKESSDKMKRELALTDSVQFSSVAQSCLTLCDPEFSRPEYWSG